MLWDGLKHALFHLDPETAHDRALGAVRAVSGVFGASALRACSGASALRMRGDASPVAHKNVWGKPFLSAVGLAAGFDKNAEWLPFLPDLGFGFAEIGTVTPRPQPGNPRPRLFRKPEARALFNRMGFNNDGAEVIAKRVAEAKSRLPEGFRVGVNLGRNKETPNASAHSDYALAAAPFAGHVDYVVANVSSPNTPGLRALQSAGGELRAIVEALGERVSKWKEPVPVLVKLAPEIEGSELADLLGACAEWGAQGFILTNTLGGVWPARPGSESGEALTGGWSGGPLIEKSYRSLVAARSVTRLPVISVGGILTVEEAKKRIQAGADLVQLYTGWIYGGPRFPARVARELQKAPLAHA